jgi:hypothetical protein
MIAFEGMTKVNQDKFNYVPSSEWNWKPAVSDTADLDSSFISASGNSSTTKNTYSNQQDHGEYE